MTEVMIALRILSILVELLKLAKSEGASREDIIALMVAKAGEAVGLPELSKVLPEIRKLAVALRALSAE